MTVSFNEFCGSLETIMMSQELEANSYANTSVEFALGENFASAKKEIEKFKHHELASLKQMVDQITNPVPQLNDLLYKNDNFVDTNLERIEERKRSWRETARTFRAFSRQLRDMSDRNTTDINALTEEAYSKLHVLIKATVTPLNHFAKNLLHKSIAAIESLVKAHRTISSVLGGTDIRTINDSIRAQKNRMLQQRREQHETLAGSVSVLNENLTKMYRYIHNCCSLYNDFINRYYTEIERLKTQNIDLDVTTLTGEMNKNLERMERTIEGVKHDWDGETCKHDWSFLDDFDEDGVLRAS